MPKIMESTKRLAELAPQMEQVFREKVLPVFNEHLAVNGLRLFDYFTEVLDEKRSKEVLNLIAQSWREDSNACLTDEALAGVMRLTGFG